MLTRRVFYSLTSKGGSVFYARYPHHLSGLFIVVKCWGKVKCLYTEQLTIGCWDKNISQGFILQRKDPKNKTNPFKMKTAEVVQQSEKLLVSPSHWSGFLQKMKDWGDLPGHVPPHSSGWAVARATSSSSSPIWPERLCPVPGEAFK